ncbi:PAS domain S-box-containing protein/diguanylate cyclase (GGDEF) domain-containing protein [Devosia sp. YR412]|uniref:PAS domain S-box protein n=1 Tax=Devosia sp. YR412 TaxID=1881030 RepID=UPI0008B076AF|nr:PAS domain S-box protein [Devosia sp. YR412]SEQ55397.1 PAS domain S-box-containing protein/diguanylate cyclase (GGDEF) domain-containing protein [Devosia sp. YR412]
MLTRVVENAAVGMVLSEMSGRMVYANKAFTSLLGHQIDPAAGQNILDIMHPNDVAVARLQLQRLMRNEAEDYRGEHRFCRADGEHIWVSVSASLLRDDAADAPLYLITQLTNIELQKKAEAALAHSESRWNFALESARQGVWDHDIVHDTMFYSRMWRVMRGIPPDAEVDGDQQEWLKRIHPDDLQHVLDNVDRQDKGDEDLDALEYRERKPDGSYVWILSRGRPVEWDKHGNPTRTLGTDTDITRLKLVELELAAEKERLRVTLNSIADGMISTDESGHVVFMNPAAEALTGWRSTDAVGQEVRAVFVVRDGETGVIQPCPVAICLGNDMPVQLDGDMILVGKAGERDIRCTAAPLKTTSGTLNGAVLVFQDVTQSRAMQRELAHSASHDDLTGLPNRAAFERALNGAIASARAGRRHGLLYIDLDRFKPVNDTAGHAAGDALLRQVAQTIRGTCRSHDVAARIGGDEFAVLLHDCPDDGGQKLADKIVRAIGALAFSWAGRTYGIGASVGITAIGEQPSSPLGFMGEADAACYAAKARGRGIAVQFRDL